MADKNLGNRKRSNRSARMARGVPWREPFGTPQPLDGALDMKEMRQALAQGNDEELEKEQEKALQAYWKEVSSPEYEDLMEEVSREIAPDPYGCECLFLETFISDEMEAEFPMIAREFLLHKYEEIPQLYEDLYGSDSAKDENRYPIDFLNRKVLNLMFLTAKQGDTYAVKMFRYLYRTYYRREYLEVKKYSSVSVGDIFSILDAISYGNELQSEYAESGQNWQGGQNPNYEIHVVARVLTMCGFIGVSIRPECAALYAELTDNHEQWEELKQQEKTKEEDSVLNIPDELLKACREQVDAWIDALPDVGMDEQLGFVPFTDSAELTHWKYMDCFLGDAFRYYGYPYDYAYRWGHHFHGLRTEFARTLAILKMRFPDMDFGFHEVQSLAPLLTCAGSLAFAMEMVDKYMDVLLGTGSQYFSAGDGQESGQARFRPEGVEKTSLKGLKKDEESDKLSVSARITGETPDAVQLQAEIDELRSRLHQAQNENRSLHSLYADARKELADYGDLRNQYDEACGELNSLREHVYRMTEEDTEPEPQDFPQMEETIKDKNIVIIGGHENWVNKLKNHFPDWTFISTDISGVVAPAVLESADYIYFFTGYLSHAAYKKYIHLLRERDLSFGYIHSRHIESVVSQIYHDLVA
ncbi:MAG: DUF2325 domain-containing protein [Lachnospiraceae bacterium]|nr:DUF2325 domain-containing protein [Lachnospiraceae bacterium]